MKFSRVITKTFIKFMDFALALLAAYNPLTPGLIGPFENVGNLSRANKAGNKGKPRKVRQ